MQATHALRCLKKIKGYLYETPRKAQDASRWPRATREAQIFSLADTGRAQETRKIHKIVLVLFQLQL